MQYHQSRIFVAGAWIFAALFVVFTACNKPSLVGADLLTQDQSKIKFTDTVSIEATTVRNDSVKVFDPNPAVNSFSSYLCGKFKDPIFGLVEATPFVQFRLSSLSPNFRQSVIDSVVLRIAYDSLSQYGNISSPQTIQVYRVNQDMSNQVPYYSNKSFTFDPTPIGKLENFIPQPKLRVSIFGLKADSLGSGNFLTVRLDNSYGTEILNSDSMTLATNDNFVKKFKGFALKMSDPKEGLVSFNLSSNLSIVQIYYKQDTTHTDYYLNLPQISGLSSTRFVNLQHTFSDEVAASFDNKSAGDQFLYLQGMGGPNVKVSLPNIKNFGSNIIVNKAELELSVIYKPGDNQLLYTPIDILITAYDKDGTGILNVTRDVQLGGLGLGAVRTIDMGGGVTVKKYKMNLSEHVQRMMRGAVPGSIVLTAYAKSEIAKHTVICGPKHPMYPMKLNLTYTEL